MSFSEKATVQELAGGSDTEGFCAPVAFLNLTQGGYKVISGVTLRQKHHHVPGYYVSVSITARKQNKMWDKSNLSP